MSKHKANADLLMTVTVFCAALSIRGIGAVANADGEHEAPAAGVFPEVIFCEGDVVAKAALQGAIPCGEHVPALAGGVIALGDEITTDAAGKFVTATAGDTICGKALTATTAADEFFKLQYGYLGVKA